MGRQTNLHRLWDGDIIACMYPSAVALYKQVQAVLQTGHWQARESGGPADWALETRRVAQEAVYIFPASREIDKRYVGEVEECALATGGREHPRH